MDRHHWTELLTRWSRELLASGLAADFASLLPAQAQQTRWLGYAGAAEAAIAAAEARLGTRLPPSYRAFLAVSDGWTLLTPLGGGLLPTSAIGWLRDLDPATVAIWGADHGRTAV